MAIPDYHIFMLLFLRCLSDGQERALADISESLASHMKLMDTYMRVISW